MTYKKDHNHKTGVFKHLIKDQDGNTMFIMAAALLPIMGLLGSAMDLGRGYMTRTRLQQACDAGALAARKAMKQSSIEDDTDAQLEGQRFFKHNFPDNTFGVETDNATFSLIEGEESGIIEASAAVTVPTTLMQIFGLNDIDVSVDCSSDIDVGNVDIMLALDTTNSMQRKTPSGVSRIRALRVAVRNFYETVGPGRGQGNNRIRYGFIPYAGNVNVGRILYDADPRWLVGGPNARKSFVLPSRRINKLSGTPAYRDYNVFFGNYINSIDTSRPDAFVPSQPVPGARERWGGCIVERQTVHISNSATSIPSGALDLDINLIPTSDLNTRWLPHWPSVIYRRDPANEFFADPSTIRSLPFRTRKTIPQLADCPSPSRKLREYSSYDEGTSNDLQSYIDGLELNFITNHTAGITWAARLLSSTGLFAAENSTAPNGRPITRHIVFMTDGEMFIRPDDYDINGINEVQGRIGPKTLNRIGVTEAQEKRFSLVCERIKSQGTTVWVVEFNDNPVVSPLMRNCASSDSQAVVATDQDELVDAFTNIANQIGGLRLSS